MSLVSDFCVFELSIVKFQISWLADIYLGCPSVCRSIYLSDDVFFMCSPLCRHHNSIVLAFTPIHGWEGNLSLPGACGDGIACDNRRKLCSITRIARKRRKNKMGFTATIKCKSRQCTKLVFIYTLFSNTNIFLSLSGLLRFRCENFL